jgi:hypothetical protein
MHPLHQMLRLGQSNHRHHCLAQHLFPAPALPAETIANEVILHHPCSRNDPKPLQILP